VSDAPFASHDIAIVGMSGRFPGARDVDELWRRVARGDDCLSDFTEAELRAAGVERATMLDDHYVRRNGVLDDVEMFDPAFFGFGVRDASVMDPQHRVLLECAWEALETAGILPEAFPGSIGVFAGCGANTYLLHNLLTNRQLMDELGWFLVRHTGNDKDFLSTGLSYRLDLRGPSINVQTACSTSLVAVHLAVQSLVAFECDLALAGGATVEVPHRVGYRYQDGEILSPTGRCRAFDAASDGTVLTSGGGMVALRRAPDAVADGDPILALIRASAVNNDGARKVSYLAPSVDGHADVVREALELAEIDARTITLLEAHGTGTAVGDPIEVAALTEAFRTYTSDTGFCRLASTKPNIGHLDTAAGVASLIKVVQALRNRELPPVANHTGPSPLLDLESTPFTLSNICTPWDSDGPRRAGVSSLGVGGTNAHVVVEEAPAPAASPPSLPGPQALCISARTTRAVEDTAARLASFIESTPDVGLADVAWTLTKGRRSMARRRVVVAEDARDAVAQLRHPRPGRTYEADVVAEPPDVVFLFPGGGAQYAGMTSGLDDRFDEFHRTLSEGIDAVQSLTGVDLRPGFKPDADPERIRQADVSLPAVFLTDVALARQWIAWGIRPDALVGHSLGEYAAAHIAGVLNLDDAIRVVATRARLMMQASGDGTAMLSVALAPEQVEPILPEGLSLAVVNSPVDCVLSGTASAATRFAEMLSERGIEHAVLPLALAAHSSLLDPILEDFGRVMADVRLAEPTIPYVSNLTGTWINADEARSPRYWVDHLRHTVRFAEGLRTALDGRSAVTLELGPGQALSNFARRASTPPVAAIPVLRHPRDPIDDTAHAIGAFARQWAHGVACDPSATIGAPAHRVRLPATAFDRQRCWIDPGDEPLRTVSASAPTPSPTKGPSRIADVADWGWKYVLSDLGPVRTTSEAPAPWLVVGDEQDERTSQIVDALLRRGDTVERRATLGGNSVEGVGSICIVAALPGVERGAVTRFDEARRRLLVEATEGLRALARSSDRGRFVVVTSGAVGNAHQSPARPEHALALGPVLSGAAEYPHLNTSVIDVDDTTSIDDLIDELTGGAEPVVALSEGRRRRRELRATRLGPAQRPAFRTGGTYIVTGGLGQIGSAIAIHLARDYQANIAVVTSTALPATADREEFLARHGSGHHVTRQLRRLAEIGSYGTEVIDIRADISDPDEVRRVLDRAEADLGTIDGVVHTAGRLRDRLIELIDDTDHDEVIGAKARGAVILTAELARRGIDQLVLISSTSTALAPPGQTSYVAANAVADALAGRHGELQVVTIGFGVWSGGGMAHEAVRRSRLGLGTSHSVEHPILHAHEEANGIHHFIGVLDTRHDWVVDEHRVGSTTAVLPGTGHLELMFAALSKAGLPTMVERVSLLEALVVDDDRPLTVRVTIGSADGAGMRRLAIESDRGQGLSWTLHSEAEHRSGPGRAPTSTAAGMAGEAVDPLERPRKHLRLGDRWNAVARARRDSDQVTALLRAPEGPAQRWIMHPALADVATACAAALDTREDDVLFVPVGYGAVTSYAPLRGEVSVVATRCDGSTSDVLVADVVILVDNQTVASFSRLQLRAVTDFDHLPAPTTDLDTSGLPPLLAASVEHGILPDEGNDLIERVIAAGWYHGVVSSLDLDEMMVSEPALVDTGPAKSLGDDGHGLLDLVISTFRDLLGVPEVAPDSDFFELGGHSLIAIRLIGRLRDLTDVRLQLSELFEVPTPSALVTRLQERRPELSIGAPGDQSTAVPGTRPPSASLHHSLVAVRAQGRRRPLFVVHGAGGNVLNLWGIARHLPPAVPVYGLQAAGIDGRDEPDPSIEAMAARYIEAIRTVQPEGPYLLAGYSGGGVVALEMSRQLQRTGEDVPLVILLDTIPRNSERPTAVHRYVNALQVAVRTGPRSIAPYLKYSLGMRFGLVRHDIEGLGLGFGDTSDSGVVNLADHFERLINAYEFGTYEVDVVIAKAEKVYPAWPWHYGWKGRVIGRIDTFVSPGNHFEMFTSENAPILAAHIAPYLADTDHD
jgi:acyl transferase domain-containing protein/thioesterase domain-containing protein/acyl carrier protein